VSECIVLSDLASTAMMLAKRDSDDKNGEWVMHMFVLNQLNVRGPVAYVTSYLVPSTYLWY
jgi:hypothetical protein